MIEYTKETIGRDSEDFLRLKEIFFIDVLKSHKDECWIWDGTMSTGNYGVFSFQGRSILAHRASFIFAHGHVPKSLFVCHKCDNTRCVNPNHLFVGNQKDNMQDMQNKRRGVNGRSIYKNATESALDTLK